MEQFKDAVKVELKPAASAKPGEREVTGKYLEVMECAVRTPLRLGPY